MWEVRLISVNLTIGTPSALEKVPVCHWPSYCSLMVSVVSSTPLCSSSTFSMETVLPPSTSWDMEVSYSP